MCVCVKTFRARLVYCNDYYIVIEISITKNKRSCNAITITIHVFGMVLKTGPDRPVQPVQPGTGA